MGKRMMLAKVAQVATAVSEGIDPKDHQKLKTKVKVLSLKDSVKDLYPETFHAGSVGIPIANQVQLKMASRQR